MLRSQIVNAFKLEGLVLELASRDLVEGHITAIRSPEKRQSELTRIVDHIVSNPELSSAKVSVDLVEEAFQHGQNSETASADDILVMDHKSLPIIVYDPVRKTFIRQPATSRAFHAADRPFNRIQAIRERYMTIHQRVSNHDLFRKRAVLNPDDNYRALTPISGLRRTKGEVCAVLGLLTQPREGAFCLEDLSHSIEVELHEETVATVGLFTENCIVLAEGEMQGEKFRIDVLAMPPIEERSDTCKRFPALSSLVEHSSTADQEKIDENTSIVVLSDVWLDRPKVQTGLKMLFTKFNSDCMAQEQQQRYIFVLMGDFSSQPAPCGYEYHRNLFDQLGRLLKSFAPLLECSSFVFIPGPNDILGGSGKLLPRQPLPDLVTSELAKHVPTSVFTSNPCRLKFYTQEIVLFREDICARLRKYSRKPQEQRNEADNNVFAHGVKTLLSQGHLCTLPLEAGPIDWAYDHALRLYPLPHALLLGCRCRDWSGCEKHVRVANPSSFGAHFSFAIYRPYSKESSGATVEDQQQPGELDIFTLDVGLIERQTAAGKPGKDEAGGAGGKKRRRAAGESRRAQAIPREAPVSEMAEGGEALGAVERSSKAAKTGRKQPRSVRPRDGVAADVKGQKGIGSFFVPGAAPARAREAEARGRAERTDSENEGGEEAPRSRRRISRWRQDSDDSESAAITEGSAGDEDSGEEGEESDGDAEEMEKGDGAAESGDDAAEAGVRTSQDGGEATGREEDADQEVADGQEGERSADDAVVRTSNGADAVRERVVGRRGAASRREPRRRRVLSDEENEDE